MKSKVSGYSFAEIVIIVLIVGVLTAIAVPRIGFSTVFRCRAETAALKITTDLRRTRRLAISDAAGNSRGFQLKMNGISPYSSYEIVSLDSLSSVDFHIIDNGVSCTGDSDFRFGPLGNLLSSGDSQIVISSAEKSYTISVIPATGLVKCQEN